MTGIATIVGSDYTPGYTTVIRSGKCLVPVTTPPEYKLYVQYDGDMYTLDESYYYFEYSDKVGQAVIVTLVTDNYDDGSSNSYISKIISESVEFD